MKYQFVKAECSRNTGAKVTLTRLPSVRREETRKLREELSDCLVFLTQEWSESTTLEGAREALRGCILQAQEEGLSVEEGVRMLFNVNSIQSCVELERYVYNYKLRASGLSVHRILRGK